MAQKNNRRNIPALINPLVWGYLAVLQKKIPIQRAYLFGSWAKGTPHRWSDIDVAVVSPSLLGFTKKNQILNRAKRAEDLTAIEPHGFLPQDFKPRENPVVDEIIKYGIRVI